jgi:hypothetical protein
MQNVSDGIQDFQTLTRVMSQHIGSKSRVKEKRRMIGDSARGTVANQQLTKHNALLAIAVGGGIAGTLDLLRACILFGWDLPLSIAGGLLGRRAVHGGVGTYFLGVLLHFFIACSAGATYYVASRKLRFRTEYPLVCGVFFGAAVEEVMNLVVLPLSALDARGPTDSMT